MKLYEHKVQYYETDQMKVVHHSNYIRWFEEARVDWMEQMGAGYAAMEKEGIISPVLEVTAKYKTMTRFGETVCIETRIESYNGIKLIIQYVIRDKETGEIRCEGQTKHCFLDESGKIVSLKKVHPGFDQMFRSMHKAFD